MKKLILPLLLLVAFGMLTAVESDPSAVVGYVKYVTTPGSDYIALPMSMTWAMAGDFGNSFAGAVTSVSRFNNQTKAWQTTSKVGTVWTGNYAIATGNVLRFVATAAIGASFYSIGALPANASTITYNLYTGSNYMMIPLNKSALSTVALLGPTVTGATSVSRFNNTTKAWQTSSKVGTIWTGSFALAIGDPLRVVTNANSTWPTRGTDLSPLTTSK